MSHKSVFVVFVVIIVVFVAAAAISHEPQMRNMKVKLPGRTTDPRQHQSLFQSLPVEELQLFPLAFI